MSEQQKKKLLRALRRREKETGLSIYDLLTDILYDPNVDAKVSERLTAIKLVMEFTIGKSTEQNVNYSVSQGPQIFLPERRPDPAKIVQVK